MRSILVTRTRTSHTPTRSHIHARIHTRVAAPEVSTHIYPAGARSRTHAHIHRLSHHLSRTHARSATREVLSPLGISGGGNFCFFSLSFLVTQAYSHPTPNARSHPLSPTTTLAARPRRFLPLGISDRAISPCSRCRTSFTHTYAHSHPHIFTRALPHTHRDDFKDLLKTKHLSPTHTHSAAPEVLTPRDIRWGNFYFFTLSYVFALLVVIAFFVALGFAHWDMSLMLVSEDCKCTSDIVDYMYVSLSLYGHGSLSLSTRMSLLFPLWGPWR